MAISLRSISPRSRNIAFALILSIVFIIAGYTLPNFLYPRAVDAESTEEMLRAYAAKDTDNDGLPDWQEGLYGADPANANSIQAGLTDKEAVDKGIVRPRFESEAVPEPDTLTDADFDVDAPAPGSLTEEFGKTFLTEYLAAAGSGEVLDQTGQDAIVERLIQEFSARMGDIITASYDISSVKTSAAVNVVTYAGAVEAVMNANQVKDDTKDPIALIDAFIYKEDKSAQPKLVALGNAYKRVAAGLASVVAPPEFATEHLALIRSFDQLGKASLVVARYEQDPLATVGALSVYEPAFADLKNAFESIADALTAAGVSPDTGGPGSFIVNAMQTP